MLSLLKKLWNWLKSLFIGSPKAINPKEVKNTPPEPSDGEYEGILMGLFEQVAAGTTTGGLRDGYTVAIVTIKSWRGG